jgi:hypothetical protein
MTISAKLGINRRALLAGLAADGWVVISMKNDWKRIFGFDAGP